MEEQDLQLLLQGATKFAASTTKNSAATNALQRRVLTALEALAGVVQKQADRIDELEQRVTELEAGSDFF